MSLITVLDEIGFKWVRDYTELYYRGFSLDDTDLHRSASELSDVLFCRELGIRVYEFGTRVGGIYIRSLHGNSGPLHEKPFTRVKQLTNLIEQTIVSMLVHVYEDNQFEICLDCQETIHEDQKHECESKAQARATISNLEYALRSGKY